MKDLKDAIQKGTKAWADVPNATEWVEELRGNVDNVDMSEKRVHKTDKSIHELDLEAPLTINGVPLYPKREWVGMTDEEGAEIWGNAHDIDGNRLITPKEIVKQIEAKLKEKNT
jgi:hypothetical protein